MKTHLLLPVLLFGSVMRLANFSVVLAALSVMPPAWSQRLSTPGQFSVGQSGAAQFSIPIDVPPGIGGMAPRLSLEYNSQGASGPFGLGWSISGLSAITRCPRTIAQDGIRGSIKFDANDRFCLDGQRLVMTGGSTYGANGTEYRTEMEQFSSLVASGTAGAGPASFVVKNKAGLTMEFGVAGSSAVAAQGKTSIAVWALNKITDVAGNYLTVSYAQDTSNGTYVPTRIDYTGNGAASPSSAVIFVTEARTDQVPQYHEGSLTKRLTRIAKIQSFTKASSGDVLVKSYNLAYAAGATYTSRLASVTECDGAAAPVCLSPVSFTMQPASAGVSEQSWPLSANTSVGAGRTFVADFNGDGKTDVLFVGNGTLYWQYSSGTGFGAVQSMTVSMASWEFSESDKVFLGDFNGDGLADIATASGSSIAVYLSTGTGFTRQAYSLSSATWGAAGFTWTGDFDGDGRTDIATAVGGTVYVRLSTGSGFTQQSWAVPGGWTVMTEVPYGTEGGTTIVYSTEYWGPGSATWVGDFNGDGKADILTSREDGSVYVRFANAAGNGFDQQIWAITTVGATYVVSGGGGGPNGTDPVVYTPGYWGGPDFAGYTWLGDFNGDGKTDIATRYLDSIRVRLSTGTGFVEQNWAVGANTFASPALTWAGDFDGDGKTDIASAYGANLYVRLSTGASFVTQTSTITNNWGDNSFVRAGDFNGDGRTDVVAMVASGGAMVRASNVNLGDKVASIGNGLGATTSVTYKPLTDAGVHTKDTSAPNLGVYPVVDVQFPLQVVSQIDQSNGLGGSLSTQYTYGGLKAEAGTGRGLLGFRWMKAKNLANNVESYTEYNQAWPFIGMPGKSETRLAGAGNAGVLKRTTTTYACQQPQNGTSCVIASGNRYFSYPGSILEESWDLNGVNFPSLTSVFQYAQSPQTGDPTQVTVSTSDGSSKTTVNEYWPANTTSGNWVLGRLKKATVTSIKP